MDDITTRSSGYSANRNEYGVRDLSSVDGFKVIDPKTYKITKPTIFCFGGNMTIMPKQTSGMIKIVEGLVGVKDNPQGYDENSPVEIIGVRYGKSGETGWFDEDDVDDFVNDFIMDLILPNGEKVDSESLSRNLGKVSFFAHCYGDEVVRDITHTIYRRMYTCGYDASTVISSIQQIYSVSYSPMRRMGEYNDHHPNTALNIKAYSDNNFGMHYMQEYVADTGVNVTPEDYVLANQVFRNTVIDNNASVYAYNFTNYMVDHHRITMMCRDDNWELRNKMIGQGKADVLYNPKVDKVSQCMGYMLARSVGNAINNEHSDTYVPNPTGKEIFDELRDILEMPVDNATTDNVQDVDMEK